MIERSSADRVQFQVQLLQLRCPHDTASNEAEHAVSAVLVDNAADDYDCDYDYDYDADADGGASGGAVACACDLCQLQLRHDSWWPNLDEIRICANVASRQLAAVDTVDRVWFSDACVDGKDYRLYPPDALDPRNYAGNCSCPCR